MDHKSPLLSIIGETADWLPDCASALAIDASLAESEGVKIVPLAFVRTLVGLLGMFFAFELGRVWVRLRRYGQPLTKAITWVLRTAVAVFAILYTRGFDVLGIALVVLIALALGAGAYVEMRPRRVDDVHLFR
jgi:hypothetical protein